MKVPNWWIEKLAELEHQQWIELMQHLFDQNLIRLVSADVQNLKRLMKLPYSKLTEYEKEKDRVFARKVLQTLRFPLEVEVGSPDSQKVK